MHVANQLKQAGMLACHLNAPLGPVVSPIAIAEALRSGAVDDVAQDETVRAALLSMFVEAEPSLILSCAREAGGTWRSADRLYRQSLADGLPHVPTWESVVEAWQ